MNTGFQLRQLRQTLQISGKILSAQLGISCASLYRFELDESSIPAELYAQLMQTFRQMISERYEAAQPEDIAALRTFPDATAYIQTLTCKAPANSKYAVGCRIRDLRYAQRMSGSQFSRFTGIDRTVLSRIEKGECGCSARNAKRIGQVCHVGVQWILTGDETFKYSPVDEVLIEYLWDHPDVRAELYAQMRSESAS